MLLQIKRRITNRAHMQGMGPKRVCTRMCNGAGEWQRQNVLENRMYTGIGMDAWGEIKMYINMLPKNPRLWVLRSKWPVNTIDAYLFDLTVIVTLPLVHSNPHLYFLFISIFTLPSLFWTIYRLSSLERYRRTEYVDLSRLFSDNLLPQFSRGKEYRRGDGRNYAGRSY